MRLAFDARMATWGGVGSYTRELLAVLARDHGQLGIESILAFRMPADDFLEDLIAPKAVAWAVAAGSPWSPITNTRIGLAARGRADVLHAPHFPIPLGFGGPLVTTIHDLIPLLLPESMPNPGRRAVYSGMVHLAMAQSDVVVCVTRGAARTIAERFAGVRLCVIHHGLGATKEAPLSEAPLTNTTPSAASPPAAGTHAAATQSGGLLGRHGLRPGYVLWVGAFKPHKDLPVLLEAYRRLPTEMRTRHPLVLVGDYRTVQGQELHRELIKSPTDREHVHLLGVVSPQDLSLLYEGAAVFAFPSRAEGFGLPPLEAMAHGIPVVSSRAAPMPEVLGDAAAYFTPGDSGDLAGRLREVLSDPAVTARLRARGRIRVRRYAWERTARETAEAYRLACTLKRGRALSPSR